MSTADTQTQEAAGGSISMLEDAEGRYIQWAETKINGVVVDVSEDLPNPVAVKKLRAGPAA